jgi:hypothetical protein
MRYITKSRIEIDCPICKQKFLIWKNDLKENNFCSTKCSASRYRERVRKLGKKNKGKKFDSEAFKKRNLRRGENHHMWKGGITYRNKKGYYAKFSIKYVRCPKELVSMARKDGYVMEHRLVMAQHFGYPLKRTEVIHHIDHNPENNKLDNLMYFPTNSAHKKYEAQNPR